MQVAAVAAPAQAPAAAEEKKEEKKEEENKGPSEEEIAGGLAPSSDKSQNSLNILFFSFTNANQ